MPWDFALPNALASEADNAAQQTAAHVDNSAFAGFYERSARPLWAYLVRASCDAALADDLMQESYVRFLCAQGAPSLADDGEVAARLYLFRIATNLLHDHWRRPRAASIDELPEEVFSADSGADQIEAHAELGPALRLMKPRERQLLWLAHAEGYSHREIAQVTGLASASIRLLLFRARRKIARILRRQHQPAGGSQ